MRPRTEGPSRQELFSELLGKWGDKAYNFAFRLTGNEPDAKDLTQEAFMKAWERLETYDGEKPFDAWLTTILHNVYVDGMRKFSHLPTQSLDSGEDEKGYSLTESLKDTAMPLLELLSGEEADRSVQRALDRLDPEMRSVVILCDMEGTSYEDAAAVMDCPVGTVRSRLARARGKLRRMLSSYKGEVGHGPA